MTRSSAGAACADSRERSGPRPSVVPGGSTSARGRRQALVQLARGTDQASPSMGIGPARACGLPWGAGRWRGPAPAGDAGPGRRPCAAGVGPRGRLRFTLPPGRSGCQRRARTGHRHMQPVAGGVDLDQHGHRDIHAVGGAMPGFQVTRATPPPSPVSTCDATCRTVALPALILCRAPALGGRPSGFLKARVAGCGCVGENGERLRPVRRALPRRGCHTWWRVPRVAVRRVPRGQRGFGNRPLRSGKGMASASGW